MKINVNKLIPIRLKQLPKYLGGIVIRFITLKKDANPISFTLCHFTCHSYYKYLYCSLHSLQKVSSGIPIRVLIFCDANEMFSPEQCEAIKIAFPDSKVIPWKKSQGWGSEQIASIWKAYSLAASESRENDYVVRIDSDVFFFSDWIFQIVARSRKDLVGDGHYVNFKYSQGGFYFLRAGAINKIKRYFEENSMDEFLTKTKINVEDIAAYQFIEQTGQKSWLTFFMMFPDEYRIAGHLSAYQKFKFCCLHFVMKNKNKMLEVYLKEIVHHSERDMFLKALEIQ
ncbi:MAG: hypothetical protein WCS87_05395 [Methylococcaceae bacterium]